MIVAEIGLPGKNFAPPEAKKIEPLKRLRAVGEVDAEVLDADAQVVELEDAAEADRARRDERVRVRRRGAFGLTGWPPYLQLRLAEREAGVADDQAGLAVGRA